VKGGGEEEERREKSNRGEKGRPLTNIPTFTLTFGVHTNIHSPLHIQPHPNIPTPTTHSTLTHVNYTHKHPQHPHT